MKTRAMHCLIGGAFLLGYAAACGPSEPGEREGDVEVTGEAAQAVAFQVTCPAGVPAQPAPDLALDKTVVLHGGSCPGTDPFITPLGSQIDYCFTVANNSTQAVHDITAVDDNGTFNYTFLTQLLIDAGLTDNNNDGQADTLNPGQSVTIQYGPIVFADPDGELLTHDAVRVNFRFNVGAGGSCLAYYKDASVVIDGPACVQQPGLCDDGNVCTTDACDPDTGCTHEAVSCNDGSACTADACDPVTGCAHEVVACDDANACTADACDAASGCAHDAVSCDDANVCTNDGCDPATGCAYDFVSCDDADACTTDACDSITGCFHEAISCFDGNACTADACDPAVGCTHGTESCDDADACTADACDPAAGCAHTAISCDDFDACTADSCDPAGGCVHTPVWCGTGTGGTRTVGYYANHPVAVAQCLAGIGGTINLGFVTLHNESADNQIDVDVDTRVETGLMLTLGMLKANIAKYTNGVHRSPLAKARMQAGQQMVAAICNGVLTNAAAPFSLNAAIQTLAGTDINAILTINNQADAFNNSNDNISLGFDGGPANSKAAWDDPTDSSD